MKITSSTVCQYEKSQNQRTVVSRNAYHTDESSESFSGSIMMGLEYFHCVTLE